MNRSALIGTKIHEALINNAESSIDRTLGDLKIVASDLIAGDQAFVYRANAQPFFEPMPFVPEKVSDDRFDSFTNIFGNIPLMAPMETIIKKPKYFYVHIRLGNKIKILRIKNQHGGVIRKEVPSIGGVIATCVV